jgi:hypothetical protein
MGHQASSNFFVLLLFLPVPQTTRIVVIFVIEFVFLFHFVRPGYYRQIIVLDVTEQFVFLVESSTEDFPQKL